MTWNACQSAAARRMCGSPVAQSFLRSSISTLFSKAVSEPSRRVWKAIILVRGNVSTS